MNCTWISFQGGNVMKRKKQAKWVKYLTSWLATLAICALYAMPVWAADVLPDGGPENDIVEAVKSIANVIINILIAISVVLMAVGIATGFVGGQFLVTVGQPYGLSGAWMKVISIIILGVGAMLTMVIVKTVLNALAGMVSKSKIPPPPGW